MQNSIRALLQKAMQVADNVVFIGLAPAWFLRARQEDMRQARFALVELCALPVPPTWPQFGIELRVFLSHQANRKESLNARSSA